VPKTSNTSALIFTCNNPPASSKPGFAAYKISKCGNSRQLRASAPKRRRATTGKPPGRSRCRLDSTTLLLLAIGLTLARLSACVSRPP
jgi:hypothetical protein